MATPNHQTETENAAHLPVTPLDPFAVDFFGGTAALADDEEIISDKATRIRKRARTAKKSDWYKNLPKVSGAEAEFSNLLSNLPENLSENAARIIAETITNYVFEKGENVGCRVISVREVNLNQAIGRLKDSPKVFLNLSSRTENASAIVALNVDFAIALIDSMLDGQGTPTGNRHELSPVETTIIEFLAGNILREINKSSGESLLFLENAKPPTSDFSAPFERGAELVLNLGTGDLNGDVFVFAPSRFIKSLDRSQNSLIERKSDRKKMTDFEKFTPSVRISLQIGSTFLDADSLLYLEPEDIVLIEQPQINPGAENFGRNLQLFLGSGTNVRFRGHADSNAFNGGLNFRIEEIISEESRRKYTPAKFQMDEKENELAEETAFNEDAPDGVSAEDEDVDEQLSPSLENIQVALRVEIAGSKISLRELQNMRAGQIIALGCAPTDPVRLITDSREEPVATGELVEIEGQLGVRLTKVFI